MKILAVVAWLAIGQSNLGYMLTCSGRLYSIFSLDRVAELSPFLLHLQRGRFSVFAFFQTAIPPCSGASALL